MNDITPLLLAGFAGLVLGAFFFGGLWWSLIKGLNSKRPGLWVFSSLMLRMGVTLVGFYAVGGGQWQRLLACGLGFFIARFLVIRILGARSMSAPELSEGGQRAS